MTSLPGTLVGLIQHWAAIKPHAPALHEKDSTNRWVSLNWKQYLENVELIASALIGLGVVPGDCVAIAAPNQIAWSLMQFGIQAAQAIPAPIYLTNTQAQAAYIVRHSQSKIVCVGDDVQLEKLLAGERERAFERLQHIITFHESTLKDDRIISLSNLKAGANRNNPKLKARMAGLDPDATSMLIYTSGTTGVPKAVELTSRGQLVISRALATMLPDLLEDGRYHVVSYLPLSHQAEQLLTNTSMLFTGGQSYFCPEIPQVREYLLQVRPTLFLGMPRVWEKFQAALENKLNAATGVQAKLVAWARKTELAAFHEQVKRGDPNYTTWTRRLARRLVIDKVKKALGLERLAVAITGSAPIAAETQEFFASLGIVIYEAYGLTECSGVATFSDPIRPVFGTIGKALSGVELRIAEDGEIQLRGQNLAKGYLHMPAETAEMLTADGWLKTGDLGTLHADGNVTITGRKKEMIITAGGKNIAPVEIENLLKNIVGVGDAVVVGDRKPFLSALITLDPEAEMALAKSLGVPQPELATHPVLSPYLTDEIERVCNSQLARYQQIKKFEVIPEPFSVEGGELTANMKLRREAIATKHGEIIARLYAPTAAQAAAQMHA